MLKNKMRARKAKTASSGGGGGRMGKDLRTNIWMKFKRKQMAGPKTTRSKPMFSDIIEQIKEKAATTDDESEAESSCRALESLVASSLIAESVVMPAGKDDGKRMHTHMMFAKKKDMTTKKKSKRPLTQRSVSTGTGIRDFDGAARLKDKQDKHDSAVQAGGDIDPSEWTGNQRVLHYGPLAVRDKFFYYYPKGWDILYPASFGFFPYRTKKFRGSSPTVCLSAFGIFVMLAGAVMTVWGFALPSSQIPFWHRWVPDSNGNIPDYFEPIPPVQIAGPVFVIMGTVCLLVGCCCWWCSLNIFTERLRHSQAHHVHLPPRRTTHQHRLPSLTPADGMFDVSPYQPTPPQYTVLSNAYTEPTLYNPDAEMKLYPPIGSSSSMLSLQRHNQPYMGSVYNTLGASKPHLGPPRAKSASRPAHSNSAQSSDQGSVMEDQRFSADSERRRGSLTPLRTINTNNNSSKDNNSNNGQNSSNNKMYKNKNINNDNLNFNNITTTKNNSNGHGKTREDPLWAMDNNYSNKYNHQKRRTSNGSGGSGGRAEVHTQQVGRKKLASSRSGRRLYDDEVVIE